MKKNVIILIIFLVASVTSSLFAQKDTKLSKGFSINLNVGIPSGQYGESSESNIGEKFQLGTIWGLQVGNRWYFNPKENHGIGLMVNWLDITIGAKSDDGWVRSITDFSFLEIGPVGTKVLTNNIALDAYYNLRPTIFVSKITFPDLDITERDEHYTYGGLGLTHAIGAAIRNKALYIGLEYVMGSIFNLGTDQVPYGGEDLGSQKIRAENFRIMIGAKF
jgi:hypothetical protein